MSYAIRFRPVDPRRADEPAMYLSTDPPRDDVTAQAGLARVTSIAGDVEPFDVCGVACAVMRTWEVEDRCRRDRLRADVVPLADALADCADVEPRP